MSLKVRKNKGVYLSTPLHFIASRIGIKLNISVSVSRFISSYLICHLNLSVPMDIYYTLPITCVLQSNDVDDEIKPMCLNLLTLLSQNLIDVEHVPGVIEIIESVITCPLWTARSLLAEFLSSFVFHNMAIISSREEWIEKVRFFLSFIYFHTIIIV